MNVDPDVCSFESSGRIEKVSSELKNHQIMACQRVCVSLCRNQMKEIHIELRSVKTKKTYIYKLENYKCGRKFVNEGKVTLTLVDKNVMILLWDVPVAKLNLFIETIIIKNSIKKHHNDSIDTVSSGSSFDKFFTNSRFNKISPLSNSDIKKYKLMKANYLVGKATHGVRLSHGAHKSEVKKEIHPKKSSILISEKELLGNSLNFEQKNIMESIIMGNSVFITGGAGTGKSFLMKHVISHLSPKSTFVTASTGIAACQINGITIHSFSGIGSGESEINKCVELSQRKPYLDMWKACKILVIDEISMISSVFFSKLERVARFIKKCNKPFGGIQLILCGDFYQLPPVIKNSSNNSIDYCFKAECWNSCITKCFELKTVYRQKDDMRFAKILNCVRLGVLNDKVTELINDTCFNSFKNNLIPTVLCTHKQEASTINDIHLKELQGVEKCFKAQDFPDYASSIIDNHTIVPNNLKLKIGARVILCTNISFSKGLSNGSTGVVRSFNNENGYPVIYFNIPNIEITISPEKFSVQAAQGNVFNRMQLPLTLSWALSIHKSQGLTLDAVQVSLSKVFAYGQAYVALSRAKSLKSLKVFGFTSNSIKVDPSVKEFYNSLKFDSS